MYIEPNSTIHVLNDVPLDIKQSDTLWFASVTEQTQYFYNHRIATFSQATYQRVNRGYCRVQMNAERLYYANYMMFQNSAYGNKWFYAFVTSVEYINDNTTQLNFSIDPIQTWFFNYETHDCFIERVTTRTDGLCEHYEPEPVQIGEQVYNSEFNALRSAYSDSL